MRGHSSLLHARRPVLQKVENDLLGSLVGEKQCSYYSMICGMVDFVQLVCS